MDPHEFRRVLDQFPIIRSRNYCASSELESSSRSIESVKSPAVKNPIMDWENPLNEMGKKDDVGSANTEGPFWEKLRLAAEKKVGLVKAEKFCEAFQRVHKKVVYEGVSLDAARRFIANEGNALD